MLWFISLILTPLSMIHWYPSGMFKADLRHAMPMTILEPFTTQLIAHQRIDEVEFLKCCCCIGKGTVTMHSTADKTAYLPGENARVTCEANNTSGQNVTAIRATLRRHVRVTTPFGGTRDDTATVSTIEMPVTCPPGSTASTVLELPIPEELQHTTDLKLIACRFEVASIAVTDGCCVSNATALLPVKYVEYLYYLLITLDK